MGGYFFDSHCIYVYAERKREIKNLLANRWSSTSKHRAVYIHQKTFYDLDL